MAFDLPLPRGPRSQGWRVKIRDKERLEPPHVTILRRTSSWRLDLRTGEFMDGSPDPADVPSGVLEVIEANWDRLCEEWDAMYPSNPVAGDPDGDGD